MRPYTSNTKAQVAGLLGDRLWAAANALNLASALSGVSAVASVAQRSSQLTVRDRKTLAGSLERVCEVEDEAFYEAQVRLDELASAMRRYSWGLVPVASVKLPPMLDVLWGPDRSVFRRADVSGDVGPLTVYVPDWESIDAFVNACAVAVDTAVRSPGC